MTRMGGVGALGEDGVLPRHRIVCAECCSEILECRDCAVDVNPVVEVHPYVRDSQGARADRLEAALRGIENRLTSAFESDDSFALTAAASESLLIARLAALEGDEGK